MSATSVGSIVDQIYNDKDLAPLHRQAKSVDKVLSNKKYHRNPTSLVISFPTVVLKPFAPTSQAVNAGG
ncbi:MAG: hypothetical protein ACI8TF_002797 [Paracoccaceae bacterium]|jgi:hypothetical protein